MPWMTFGNGGVAHVKLSGRGRKRDLCSWCHRFLSDVLCDHRKPGSRKRCSKPLCRDCAEHVEPDLDYCPNHQPSAVQTPLFGDAA